MAISAWLLILRGLEPQDRLIDAAANPSVLAGVGGGGKASSSQLVEHIFHISDLSKMRQHYPQWDISISLDETIGQIVEHWRQA